MSTLVNGGDFLWLYLAKEKKLTKKKKTILTKEMINLKTGKGIKEEKVVERSERKRPK